MLSELICRNRTLLALKSQGSISLAFAQIKPFSALGSHLGAERANSEDQVAVTVTTGELIVWVTKNLRSLLDGSTTK